MYRNIVFIFLFLVFFLPTFVFALELKLDEHLPVSAKPYQSPSAALASPIIATQTSDNYQQQRPQEVRAGNSEKEEVSAIEKNLPPDAVISALQQQGGVATVKQAPIRKAKPVTAQKRVQAVKKEISEVKDAKKQPITVNLNPPTNQQRIQWLWLLLPVSLLMMTLGWWLGGHTPTKAVERGGNTVHPKRKIGRNKRRKRTLTPEQLVTLQTKTNIRFKGASANQKEKKQAVKVPTANLNVDVLNRAYSFHRSGQYDRVISVFKRAFQHHPHEVNIYVVAISILLESENNPKEFYDLVQDRLQRLKDSDAHAVWREVMGYGEKMAPDFFMWEDKLPEA